MNFLLGLFTGIALMIFLGIWLNEREKRRTEAARKQHLDTVKSIWSGFRISPEDLAFLNSNPPKYPLSEAHAKDLNEQIQAAIQREDFEEAARLRDLINRK